MAHRVGVGQEMAVAVEPGDRADVHGVGSTDHDEPFHSRTEVPTTAAQNEVLGQETPTVPAWNSEVVVPPVEGAPKDWVADQLEPFMVDACPVLSTTAQNVAVRHETEAWRQLEAPPGWPGLGGSAGPGLREVTDAQLVPSPRLT
jgi:hypothetical protein